MTLLSISYLIISYDLNRNLHKACCHLYDFCLYYFSCGSHALQQHHGSMAWSIRPWCTTLPRSVTWPLSSSFTFQSFSPIITRLSLFSEYRAVCNSTDVLSVNWRSQNPAHSSRLQNWHRLADRKASWQHWVMAKSLKGSFPESLCYVKGLCNIIIILLLLCAMSKWFGVLQIFLKALVHSLCLVLSLWHQYLIQCNSL